MHLLSTALLSLAISGTSIFPFQAGGLPAGWGAKTVPLPGPPRRFDYQSLDAGNHLLYVAHMRAGEVIVFNTRTEKVVKVLKGTPGATGLLVVPELQKLFVSASATGEVVVFDTRTFKSLARIPSPGFPDGLAYVPGLKKLYVSGESGRAETVIDARNNRRLATIELGGEAGNSRYDRASGQILVNVQTRREIVSIDPRSDSIVGRHRLQGALLPHGLLILTRPHLAFVACEGNSRLLVVDLDRFRVLQTLPTGEDPDVLSFDPGLARLYVAAESGMMAAYQLEGKQLRRTALFQAGPNAHSVQVEPETHRLFLPLIRGPEMKILTVPPANTTGRGHQKPGAKGISGRQVSSFPPPMGPLTFLQLPLSTSLQQFAETMLG